MSIKVLVYSRACRIYFFMICFTISFPKANTIRQISRTNPTICALSRNLSLKRFTFYHFDEQE